MKAKHKRTGLKKRVSDPWFLYILRCCDNTLYTGITKDTQRRIKMHQEGKASRYTRTRRPVKLLHLEPCRNHSEALIRECAVKSYSRKKKKALISFQEDKPHNR